MHQLFAGAEELYERKTSNVTKENLKFEMLEIHQNRKTSKYIYNYANWPGQAAK